MFTFQKITFDYRRITVQNKPQTQTFKSSNSPLEGKSRTLGCSQQSIVAKDTSWVSLISYRLPYEKGRDEGSELYCIDRETLFELPEGWEWSRLGFLGSWRAGATPAKSRTDYYDNGTIPWLLTGDLNDGIILTIPQRITEKALIEYSLRINPVGSILIAMYGATIGEVGILGIPATTDQACCACIPYDYTYSNWIYTWLLSHKPVFVELGLGGAQPNISKDIMYHRLH